MNGSFLVCRPKVFAFIRCRPPLHIKTLKRLVNIFNFLYILDAHFIHRSPAVFFDSSVHLDGTKNICKSAIQNRNPNNGSSQYPQNTHTLAKKFRRGKKPDKKDYKENDQQGTNLKEMALSDHEVGRLPFSVFSQMDEICRG